MCSHARRTSAGVLALILLAALSMAEQSGVPFERAMSYWADRDDMKSLTKAVELFEAVLASNPEPALERRTRLVLSQAYYWYGNMLPENDNEARKEAYKKGMDVLNPILTKNPEDHEANFWYAVNLSSHSREVGILKSVSKLSEIKRRLAIVTKKDEYYFFGGPNRLYAKIIQQAPGFLRKAQGQDLSDAEKLLLANIERYPYFLMNRLFLGEVYRDQNRIENACKEFKAIIDTPPDQDPACAAENRRDIREAEKLLLQLQAKYPDRCK